MEKRGLLLVNLGTPSAPTKTAVSQYLAEFLSDKNVISLPGLLRYLLLYGFILPFRTPKTTRAYQHIWTKKGSPLLVHSRALEKALQKTLKPHYKVQLAMRYGEPSLKLALTALEDCTEITVLPLFPQYANATTGSILKTVFNHFKQAKHIPTLHIISSFHENPAYIKAQAALIKPYLKHHEFVLFSYHGLPLNQIKQSGCAKLCTTPCPTTQASHCYRAQCYATTASLAKALHLESKHYDTSFQSRLGFTPWTSPYTTELLSELARKGIKRLLVVCPSFTADCLETLEEIGYAAKAQWLSLGGECLTLVPALNTDPTWVKNLIQIARLHPLNLG